MNGKLYRRGPDGSLEREPVQGGDYRRRLRSRRWDPAPLENPEARSPSPTITFVLVLAACLLTFVVLVLGYASGFWG